MAAVTPPTAVVPPPSPTSPSSQQNSDGGSSSLWYLHQLRGRADELFRKRDLERTQRPYGAHHLIAGTSAGLVTTAVLYPLDLIKTRYQARRDFAKTVVIALSQQSGRRLMWYSEIPSHLDEAPILFSKLRRVSAERK